MKRKPDTSPLPKDLRARAEDRLAKSSGDRTPVADEDTRGLMHNLQVQEIELQIQNDELRQSQAELQSARDWFSNLYDFAPCALLTLGPEGEVAEANLGAAGMLGLGRAALCLKRLSSFIPVQTRSAFESYCEQVLRAGSGEPKEFTVKAADGRWLILLVKGIAIADPATHETRCCLSLTDITEIKQTEDKLRQLSSAVEQSIASIMITNLTGEIEYVNPRFTELTGYTAAEVLGRNPRLLKSCETGSETYRELWRTITAGGVWRGLFHNRKKSGELYWENTTISPILGPSGNITHFLAVKEDITARKQGEEDLRKVNQSLQAAIVQANSANRAKSQFLAMMSHEIRTPMNAVLGMTNLLLATPLDARQAEFARTVATSGDALLEIINDILDFSKIEAGEHFQVEETVFSLPDLVTGVVQLLMTRAQARGLSLTAELADGLPGTIKSDDGRLRQVLINLAATRSSSPTGAEFKSGCDALAPKNAGPGCGSRCKTRASGSAPKMPPGFSSPSYRRSAAIPGSAAAPAWAWPFPRALSSGWGAASEWIARRARDQRSGLSSMWRCCRPRQIHRGGLRSAKARRYLPPRHPPPRRLRRCASWWLKTTPPTSSWRCSCWRASGIGPISSPTAWKRLMPGKSSGRT